jgi:1-deoxy-D-xylulose-5-phosphate reductoisomerase
VSKPEQITVLGATGSVGISTLDVIARHPDLYQVFALTGFSRLSELLALCVLHKPRFAVVPTPEAARSLQADLVSAALDTRVLVGEGGLCEVSVHPEVDTVLAAIVGGRGRQENPAGQQGSAGDVRRLVHAGCTSQWRGAVADRQ